MKVLVTDEILEEMEKINDDEVSMLSEAVMSTDGEEGEESSIAGVPANIAGAHPRSSRIADKARVIKDPKDQVKELKKQVKTCNEECSKLKKKTKAATVVVVKNRARGEALAKEKMEAMKAVKAMEKAVAAMEKAVAEKNEAVKAMEKAVAEKNEAFKAKEEAVQAPTTCKNGTKENVAKVMMMMKVTLMMMTIRLCPCWWMEKMAWRLSGKMMMVPSVPRLVWMILQQKTAA
jgi:myosin heavy subunit